MDRSVFFNSRQNLILGNIHYFKYLTTSQLYTLAFEDSNSGIRYCQIVMKKMFNNKEVKRFRHREFIYYVGKKNQGWQSIVALNNLYFDIRAKGKAIQFQPELVFFSGRCDGFFVAEYRGKKRKFFVEIDRATAPFNKASIYNTLLQTDWENEPWADPLKRGVISFPLVVVLTIRRQVVERDFMKAKFNYYILDLYEPGWEIIFEGGEGNDSMRKNYCPT